MRHDTAAPALYLVVGVALYAVGCGCLSAPRAKAKRAALLAQNRDRAAPAMRAAAEAHGAVLLPNEVREMELPPDCDEDTNAPRPADVVKAENPCAGSPDTLRTCAHSRDRGRTFILRRTDGPAQLILPIFYAGAEWRYVRLARRGDTLIVLHPEIISQRTVGSARECSCSLGQTFDCPPRLRAFVIDVVFTPRIEEVSVPMVEDTFDWSCKVRLL